MRQSQQAAQYTIFILCFFPTFNQAQPSFVDVSRHNSTRIQAKITRISNNKKRIKIKRKLIDWLNLSADGTMTVLASKLNCATTTTTTTMMMMTMTSRLIFALPDRRPNSEIGKCGQCKNWSTLVKAEALADHRVENTVQRPANVDGIGIAGEPPCQQIAAHLQRPAAMVVHISTTEQDERSTNVHRCCELALEKNTKKYIFI
ncbi:hypothetical protein Tsp_08556 [Trichinella spiralis]|uniref:hypothetical protein n=1 Tax=Trichinella spiralis TaxID=6334 RepID=UPI0001EFBD3A|nr:hypothetical protein Tsp_08556 [Trichinella spiralis]